MKRRFALLFSVCLAAIFLFSACSSKEEEPEAEEGRMDFEDWEEQGGEETEEITDDFSYITDLVSGLEDCYVRVGSTDIHYEEGLTVDDPDLITGFITDDSNVDLSVPGVYTVAFTLIIDDDVLGEEPVDDIVVYRTVEVVDDDRAVEVAAEGKLIWESHNEIAGICATEGGISTMPLYINFTVEDITDHVATFRIENYSGYEITYGLSFDLEVEKDDDWVPLNRKEEVTFEDVSYVLKDRSEVEIECDLAPYGELQDGNYRMLKDDVYVEFTIKDGKLAQP